MHDQDKTHEQLITELEDLRGRNAALESAGIDRGCIERRQADEALRSYGQRLEVIQRIARRILTERSLDTLAQIALDRIQYLLPSARASIVKFELETNEATVVAVHIDGETAVGSGARLPIEMFGTGADLRQGKIRVVEDMQSLSCPSAVEQTLLREGIRSQLIAPLVARGELVGTLNLGADRPGAYVAEQIDIAAELAELLAIAIQQASLHEQIQRHAQELEQEVAKRTQELLTLYTISEITLNTQPLKAAYQAIVEQISSTTGFPIVAIEHYDESRQLMVLEGISGIPLPPDKCSRETAVAETISGTVVSTGRPLVETQGRTRPESTYGLLPKFEAQTYVCVPMAVGGRVIGALSLAHPDTMEPDSHLPQLATGLANHVALLSERVRAEDALRASEAEQRSLIAAMTDLIFVVDAQGQFLKVPPTNPDLLYRPADEVIGKTVHDIFPARQAVFLLNQVRRALETGQTVNIEYCLPIDGVETWFAAALSPLSEDQVVCVARDITDRVQAEETRRKLSQLEERQRIAVEMHDGLGQSLNYLGLKVEQTVESLAAGHSKEVLKELRGTCITIKQIAQELRQTIACLREEPQPPQSLQDRLGAIAAELASDDGPRLHLAVESRSPLLLPQGDAEQVVRVVREAALNAIHHARADHILVRQDRQDLDVVVAVEDNGCGFDPQASPADGDNHFGLSIMRARAACLGGELFVCSTPEQGTRVILRWPLARV